MNTAAFKRMLVGEPVPDKDDPRYRQRYEDEVKAGRRFARFAYIDVAAAKVQQFALDHARLFLFIVFGFITLSFSVNMAKIAMVCHSQGEYKTATSKQDSVMRSKGMTHATKKPLTHI